MSQYLLSTAAFLAYAACWTLAWMSLRGKGAKAGGDEISGKGFAELSGEKLTGRIAFHQGDESGFVAQKARKTRN